MSEVWVHYSRTKDEASSCITPFLGDKSLILENIVSHCIVEAVVLSVPHQVLIKVSCKKMVSQRIVLCNLCYQVLTEYVGAKASEPYSISFPSTHF